MLKKYSTQKKIAVASILVPALGILSKCIDSDLDIFKILVQHVGSTIYLASFDSDAFTSSLFKCINLFFYFLLLLGGIFYIRSNYKETRLVRFVFSIIFFTKILSIFFSLFFFFSNDIRPERSTRELLFLLSFLLSRVLWLWISYSVLKELEQMKVLQRVKAEYGTLEVSYFEEATRWKRVFHLIVDLLITFLIFSGTFQLLIRKELFQSFFKLVQEILGDKLTGVALLILCRLIYYFIFEQMLGATPGKFLTETRVVNDDGHRPAALTILGRTLSRFIPFEPLSFFGVKGWHDSMSKTDVVNEIRTGVKGSLYFYLLPITAVFLATSYVGLNAYKKNKAENLIKNETNRLLNAKHRRLSNLTENDLLVLEPVEYEPEKVKIFLKVKKENNSAIELKGIAVYDNHNISHFELEKLYLKQKDSLPDVAISLNQLKAALQLDTFEDRKIIPLSVYGKKYYITNIESIFGPDIHLDYSSDHGKGAFELNFRNKGWACYLTEVKVLEGDVKISMSPQRIGAFGDYESLFNISGTTRKHNLDYRFKLTVKDSLNKAHVYQVEDNTSGFKKALITKINP